MKRKIVLIASLFVVIPAALVFHFLRTEDKPGMERHGVREAEKPTPTVEEFMTSLRWAVETDGSNLVNESWTFSSMRQPLGRMLQRREFDKLEGIVARLRRENLRRVDGSPVLPIFYTALGKSCGSEQQPLFEQLDEWGRKYPRSVAPPIILADAYIDHAWDARGGGWAYTVSGSAWPVFRERLKQAEEHSRRAELLSTNEARLYVGRLWLGIGLGWKREKMESNFRRAVAIDPHYYNAYEAMAIYLLPRWYGSTGEHLKFVEEAPAKHLPDEDDTLFWRLAVNTMAYGGWDHNNEDGLVFLSDPKRRERFLESLENAGRRYPRSAQVRFRHAHMAMKVGDSESARRLLRNMSTNTVAGLIHTTHAMEPWLDWAKSEPSPDPILARFTLPDRLPGLAVDFSPDGGLLAIGSEGHVTVRSAEGPEFAEIQSFHCSRHQIHSVRFSPDGRLLAAGSGDLDIHAPSERFDIFVWNTNDWHQPVTLRSVGTVSDLRFTPDAKTLIAVGGRINRFEQIEYINLDTLERKAVERVGMNHVFNLVRYQDTDQYLGSAGQLVFMLHKGEIGLAGDTMAPDAIGGMAVTPDGKHLVCGRYYAGGKRKPRGWLEMWELENWQPLSRLDDAVLGGVRAVAITPDNRLLLAAGDDMLVSIWDINTGRRVGNLVGHTSMIHGMDLSPDGSLLATAAYDGKAILWDWRKALPPEYAAGTDKL